MFCSTNPTVCGIATIDATLHSANTTTHAIRRGRTEHATLARSIHTRRCWSVTAWRVDGVLSPAEIGCRLLLGLHSARLCTLIHRAGAISLALSHCRHAVHSTGVYFSWPTKGPRKNHHYER